MVLKISAIGTAVPPYAIGQADAASVNRLFCVESDKRLRVIDALYRRAGVTKRHSVLLETDTGAPFDRQSFYPRAAHCEEGGPTTRERMDVYEREAPRLALEAAGRAVDASGCDPGSFTHLVTVSCTGFQSPGIDAALIEELGLPRAVERTHVGFMGCHGALNGIRVAAAFARAQRSARILVCAVELCTLHFFYGWDAEKIVANSLFADGAGALVGVVTDDDDRDAWKAVSSGTFLMPDSADAMTWRIGDHGFHMTLSSQVPKMIRRHVGGWIEDWLGENGLATDDVATWVVHPGGPRILTAFEDAVALPPDALDASRAVLADFGNMSSATVLFVLERLREVGAPRPCVVVGFGPGLVVEALLLR